MAVLFRFHFTSISPRVQLLFEDFGFAGMEGSGIIGEYKLINSVKQVYEKLRQLSRWMYDYLMYAQFMIDLLIEFIIIII
jgi:hypothetical protein